MSKLMIFVLLCAIISPNFCHPILKSYLPKGFFLFGKKVFAINAPDAKIVEEQVEEDDRFSQAIDQTQIEEQEPINDYERLATTTTPTTTTTVTELPPSETTTLLKLSQPIEQQQIVQQREIVDEGAKMESLNNTTKYELVKSESSQKSHVEQHKTPHTEISQQTIVQRQTLVPMLNASLHPEIGF